MNMSDATHSELEGLKRLYRCAARALAGLQQLHERSPEDELRLRAQLRLTGRLSDRIQWMEAQRNATQGLVAAASSGCTNAAPESVRTDYGGVDKPAT
jgi:hypothetical protein